VQNNADMPVEMIKVRYATYPACRDVELLNNTLVFKMRYIILLVLLPLFVLAATGSLAFAAEPLVIYVGFHKNLGVLTIRELSETKVSVRLDGEFGESPGGFCGGELDSIGVRRKGTITVKEPQKDPKDDRSFGPCKIKIMLRGNRATVQEISGCGFFHGACASFSGQARKVYPK